MNLNICRKTVAIIAFAVSIPTILLGCFMLVFVNFNHNLLGGLVVFGVGVAMLMFAIILSVNKIIKVANIGLIMCNTVVGSFCLYTAISWWGCSPISINVILPLVVLFTMAVSIGFSVACLIKQKRAHIMD